MQVDYWKKDLLEAMRFHTGNRSDIIEDIFACYEDDILETSFSYAQCADIAKRLNVSLEQLKVEAIDWEALKANYFSQRYCVPEQYSNFAGTHMSSVRSIISFFDSRFTSRASQSLLQQLDLHQDVLLNDNIKLNNHFINNMFQIMLQEYCMSKADIDLMSIMVHRYSMRSSVIKMSKSCMNNSDIIKVMIANASKYELTNEYNLAMHNNSSLITSSSKFTIDSHQGKDSIMKEPLVYFKISTIKHMTSLMGREPMKISAHELSFERGHQILKIKVEETDRLSSLRGHLSH